MARRLRAVVASAASSITMALGTTAGLAHSGHDHADSGDRAKPASFPSKSELSRVLGSDRRQDRKGLYVAEVKGQTYTTHGPDAVPAAGEENPSVATGPKPERAPACVTGGKHIHLLYAYTPGAAPGGNLQSTIGEHIRTITRQNNSFLNQESLASSGGGVTADLKVLCGATGQIRVDAFEIVPLANDPQTAEDERTWGVSDWRRIMAAGAKAGFDDPKVDYEVFSNAPGASGIATWRADQRLTAQNENNNPGHPFGSGWAIVYASSWDRQEVSLHELGHAMGAVGNGAAHSSGAAHCWDEQDTMCYRDGGPTAKSLIYNCSAERFDCGFDDYFDAKPEPGEYLSSHWNLGSPLNAMIAFSGAPEIKGPTADFTYTCKLAGLPYVGCSFRSTSRPGDVPITEYHWDFADGYTATGISPVHDFNSLIDRVKVLTRGVWLKVIDANGLESTVVKPVTLLGAGGSGDDGVDDDPSATLKTAVKVTRAKAASGGRVAVTVKARDGAQGRVKLTSRKSGRSRSVTVRHRDAAKRVRLRVPDGTSWLIVRYDGTGRWADSKARYRVSKRGGKVGLRRL